MVAVTEAARLRAEIEQARRRRDSARAASEVLSAEIRDLKAELAAGPAPATGAEVKLEVGDRVCLLGLAEAPQLSGQEAEVVGKDAKKGRFKVRLASGELRQVPTAYLQPLARAAAMGPAMAGPREPPLLSASSLRQFSCLPEKAGGVPCELWPLVHSSIARVLVPESCLQRLRGQLDAAARHVGALDRSSQLLGEIRRGCQVTIERVDKEYERILLEMCNILAFSLLGSTEFRCEVDTVWGVVQRDGDYSPVQAYRNKKAPTGFTSFLDIELPSQLSAENHERPTKGAYGFHDGIHNILWKSDRTTDKYDLVQPGIIQCELVTGYIYIFPQQLQSYTFPFDGPGDRKWIASSVALLDVAPAAC